MSRGLPIHSLPGQGSGKSQSSQSWIEENFIFHRKFCGNNATSILTDRRKTENRGKLQANRIKMIEIQLYIQTERHTNIVS